MIDKLQYYHGAAIVALLENENFSVKKKGLLGYVVNEKVFVFLKYTTKARSPWRFSFDQEDIDRCLKMESEYSTVILGLVCGGDGVCALTWKEARSLLSTNPGWISVQRKHNKSYGVAGSISKLKGKVSVRRWSNIVSEVVKY
ncbi:hypothetical protein A2738_00170 [Candidatus Nomurabacteria bacterium RIFCSPHIGHO2_01_FULL_42_15]|uniref:Uncharacterized protein n=1 Tax=Candidatus Nomurabacteria bacterium RIFCSPHIGHO2_01_FULL_42_15 TaxID=1801742 RepID=A0A1F6VGI3_9BACT|nr:MAG: hypothetical protein A2738_00170 [Candidatus Nomurabacteria bacterium RIFCSPHIGHO2_01_FULL_42_15]OGI92883.1 MAG: hypothetical protein A3A99_02440 [Candidatus Nomurabacteria bacterium RIFCSPLOWO2_01_FULL_41_18]